MRSNTYYHNLSRVPDKQSPEREKLEEQIKQYLAKGGKVTDVPRGSSAARPITEHDPRKKLKIANG
jgi:predicted GNAT superfamily acetyltransferase